MSQTSSTELPTKLEVHYQKSGAFRVVYAEGCFGGLSGRGMIHSSFYNERSPIPMKGEMKLENGLPVGEDIVEQKQGVFREVEVDVVMDLNAAVAYHAWLGDKIEDLRKNMNINDEQWAALKGSIK